MFLLLRNIISIFYQNPNFVFPDMDILMEHTAMDAKNLNNWAIGTCLAFQLVRIVFVPFSHHKVYAGIPQFFVLVALCSFLVTHFYFLSLRFYGRNLKKHWLFCFLYLMSSDTCFTAKRNALRKTKFVFFRPKNVLSTCSFLLFLHFVYPLYSRLLSFSIKIHLVQVLLWLALSCLT